jgi:hypothetical protein
MGWAEDVERRTYGEKRNTYRFLVIINLTEGDKLEGLHVDGRIILKRTLKKQEGYHGLDSFDLDVGTRDELLCTRL